MLQKKSQHVHVCSCVYIDSTQADEFVNMYDKRVCVGGSNLLLMCLFSIDNVMNT